MNGYSNYETWCAALWLSNDYCLQETIEHEARVTLTSAKLSDFIESLVYEMAPELDGMFGDLLTNAIERVDFYEIAETYMEE